MEKDEYTEAWGEDAIQPPAEGSVQSEAKKRARAEQDAYDEAAREMLKEDQSQ